MQNPETAAANRLANASSPYLRQHAGNPVHWYPWGPEAFAAAKQQGKPLMLSIGYAACHWCHVMAHESFEDQATADLLNEHFISVKVDREERPDLDHIYQAAHQLLTRRSGGWPLTVFLTEDQAPFFSGTYFPREARHGMPSFGEVLERIVQVYRKQNAALRANGQAVREALNQLAQTPPAQEMSARAVETSRARFLAGFDLLHGGLGQAPKFPRVPELEFCLRAAHEAKDAELLQATLFSLRRMAEGGLHDHLGGGFFRYCVDGFWEIPHFEKMLYDNALLLRLYADTFALTGGAVYREAAEGIYGWLLAEMCSSEGLFFSSLDADSEQQEGKYYVWSPEELRALLSEEAFVLASEHWGWRDMPNFEGQAWHLRVKNNVEQLAERRGQSAARIAAELAAIRRHLKAKRDQRVRPGLDDKCLTAWNALTITGLARGARVFGRPDWLATARRAHRALLDQAWHGGRLSAIALPSRSRLAAYLDDYAFLLEATLELMEADWRQEDFSLAGELAQVLITQFLGADGGGFFFTAAEHENLLARTRNGYDHATPSGNGVAAKSLLRLGHLGSDRRYRDAAEATLRALAPRGDDPGEGQGAMLSALLEWQKPLTLVCLRGPRQEMESWLAALPAYRPGVLALALGEAPGPQAAPPAATLTSVAAWICREGTCLPPMVNFSSYRDVMGLTAG